MLWKIMVSLMIYNLECIYIIYEIIKSNQTLMHSWTTPAFKANGLETFEQEHFSNLLPFLDKSDEHSLHDLISVTNIKAYYEFLKWCAFGTVSQVKFRKIEHDGVDKCLTIYDEALAIFALVDKYRYWRADYMMTVDHQNAGPPSLAQLAEGEEARSDTCHQGKVTPKFSTGTTKAWSAKAVDYFNMLCASIAHQRKQPEYDEVLKLVQKNWLKIDEGGNYKKRKAIEMMKLQLMNKRPKGLSNDKVFSSEKMKESRVDNVGSVVTKYNIDLTDSSVFEKEKALRIQRIRRKQEELRKEMETLTAIGTGDDSEREQEPEDGNSGTGRTGTPGQDAVTTLTAV